MQNDVNFYDFRDNKEAIEWQIAKLPKVISLISCQKRP